LRYERHVFTGQNSIKTLASLLQDSPPYFEYSGAGTVVFSKIS